MSEAINDKQVFSLLEVTNSIRKTLVDRYKTSFWVKAEMNKLNFYSYSGHCYPDLVEKKDGKVVAQVRANLWKDDYLRINSNFLATLKEPLKDGINILFKANIGFDPVHGLSLKIMDIDPVFSLGELEREKLETIQELKIAGIFDQNRKLNLPLLPQRIAIVSVETSKGYSDFLKIIADNQWGYKFFCYLFPALLQGDKSVNSILAQLKKIKKVRKHFDMVAIVRGGGGDVGLSSYNNYLLSKEIALFPIPVLTGIGHSTNETVVEMVAFRNAITPTELADFLLQRFHNFSLPLQKAQEKIVDRSRRMLQEEALKFQNAVRYFKSITGNTLTGNRNEVKSLGSSLSQHAGFFLRNKKDQVTLIQNDLHKSFVNFTAMNRADVAGLEKSVSILDPVNVLRRGYSITLKNGKAINGTSDVKKGDEISTLTADGTIISTVKDTENR